MQGTAFPPPVQPFAALSGLKLFVYAVVRSLFCDVDIMRMALAECGCGDLNKMTVLLKLFDIMSTAISHTGTKTAQHLEYGILNESLVSDTSFIN